MKRKNILKFVSLLGIGSFVMLAAASCSQAATRTPSSNSSSSNTNSMPAMNNTPSSGANMNSVDPELAAARMALSTSVGTKEQNTNMYVDYAKIQKALTDAYSAAQAVLDNSGATTQNLKDAKSTLDAAISTAASSKQSFDTQNPELVKAYGELKMTLGGEAATLAPLAEEQFAGIKTHLSGLYDAGKEITKKTLDPLEGDKPEKSAVTDANTKITEAIKEETLKLQKENANQLHGSFIKQGLDKSKITGTTDSSNQQPSNYSFVGYSSDVTISSTGGGSGTQMTAPNWNFAQRTIFSNDNTAISNTASTGNEEEAMMSKPLSDVSWIYSLDVNGKYTLQFDYYGPSTGYLYFPYKLVKAESGDSTKVGLQYKLNESETQTEITFGAENTMNGATPTVDTINVATLTLSNLKFGSNTIEFSVPSDKVIPMIGNMYLTSTPDNLSKVHDDIFGNSVETKDNKTVVSVSTLNGYSLAADWSTFIRKYNSENLMLDNKSASNQTYYLIGYVGGTSKRNGDNIIGNNQNRLPEAQMTEKRTYTFYVNAPEEGDYYISGIYLSGTQNNSSSNRWLQFKTGEENNVVKFETPGNGTYSNEGNWDSKLMSFDTAASSSTAGHNAEKKTLKLKSGLNKVVVSGVMDKDSGNAPNFGHLKFTLMNQSTEGESQPSSSTSAGNS